MAITASDRNAIYLKAPKATSEDTRLGLGSAAFLNLASPFLKVAVINGGSAGDRTVTGIKTTDALRFVAKIPGAGTAVTDIIDLTSEFTITATNTINNTSGTTTASSKVLVVYVSPS